MPLTDDNEEEEVYPHRDKPYKPSSKDGPSGPRDNEQQLADIQDRTDEFAKAAHDKAEGIEEEAADPFAPEHVHAFTLITLMRIYDVGMALLNEQNSEMATKLHELHTDGKLAGSFPWINAED